MHNFFHDLIGLYAFFYSCAISFGNFVFILFTHIMKSEKALSVAASNYVIYLFLILSTSLIFIFQMIVVLKRQPLS